MALVVNNNYFFSDESESLDLIKAVNEKQTVIIQQNAQILEKLDKLQTADGITPERIAAFGARQDALLESIGNIFTP